MANGTGYQGGGDSVIFQNFQPLVGMMQQNQQYVAQQAQEQRKERDKVMQQVSKDLSGVDSSGLRKADLELFNEKYDNVKETYFQIQSATDHAERRALQLKLNSDIGEVKRVVKGSNQVRENIIKSGNNIPKIVGIGNVEGAQKFINELKEKRYDEITEDSFDLSQFYFKGDKTKLDRSVDRIAKQLIKDPTKSTFTSQIMDSITASGGKRYDFVSSGRVANEPAVFEAMSNLVKSDRNAQAYVQDLIDAGEVEDFNQGVATLIEEYQPLFSNIKDERVAADRPTTGGGGRGGSMDDAFRNFRRDIGVTINDSGDVANAPVYASLNRANIKTTLPSNETFRSQDGQNVNLKAGTEVQVSGVTLMPMYRGKYIANTTEEVLRQSGREIEYKPTVMLQYKTTPLRGSGETRTVFAEPQYIQSLSTTKTLNKQLEALEMVMDEQLRTGNVNRRTHVISDLEQDNQPENTTTPNRDVTKLVDLIKGK